MKAEIIRPDEKMGQYRFDAYIYTPDGTAHMIFAYESNAIKWIREWCADRSLKCPAITSFGPQSTGGEYLVQG